MARRALTPAEEAAQRRRVPGEDRPPADPPAPGNEAPTEKPMGSSGSTPPRNRPQRSPTGRTARRRHRTKPRPTPHAKGLDPRPGPGTATLRPTQAPCCNDSLSPRLPKRMCFEALRLRDNRRRIVRERANLCLADGAGEACGEERGERPAGEGEEHTDPADGLAAAGGGEVAC